MNCLLVSAAALLLGALSAHAQGLVTGKVQTGTPSYVQDQNVPLSLDASGNLRTQSVAVPSQVATGGLSVYRVMNAASATAVAIKASPGRLYSFNLCNNANAARYVRFYNATTATTGTTPVYAGAITLSSGTCQQYTTNFGLTFSAGISMAITAANGDADTTAPLAGDVSGFIGYL